MEFTKPDLPEFMTHFAAQFEEADAQNIQADQAFRTLGEWTSMQSLIVIASFDEAFGVTISAEELKQSQTVMDLFSIVQQKKP